MYSNLGSMNFGQYGQYGPLSKNAQYGVGPYAGQNQGGQYPNQLRARGQHAPHARPPHGHGPHAHGPQSQYQRPRPSADEGATRLMQRFDTNGDGAITKAEILAVFNAANSTVVASTPTASSDVLVSAIEDTSTTESTTLVDTSTEEIPPVPTDLTDVSYQSVD